MRKAIKPASMLKSALSVALALSLSMPMAQAAYAADAAEADGAESYDGVASSLSDEEIAQLVADLYASYDSTSSGSASSDSTSSAADNAGSDADVAATADYDDALMTASSSEMQAEDTTETETMVSIEGADRYATAAEEALYAFDSSTYAIIASGFSPADALASTSLAGALDCPILLVGESLLSYTADALDELGVDQIIIVGGTSAVSSDVESALRAYGTVSRLSGQDRYATQMAIYSYGAERSMWDSSMAIVASGESFADSLSISPVAFSKKAPVFIVDGSGALPQAAANALAKADFNRIVAVGGSAVISDSTITLLSNIEYINYGDGNVEWIYGQTRYETSAEIGRWAVSNGFLGWDGVAFARGDSPYDALAGSVVQGKTASVLLLVSSDDISAADSVSPSAVSRVRFFGGKAVIPTATRVAIMNKLGKSSVVLTTRSYDVTLESVATLENQVSSRYTYDEYLSYLDPEQYTMDDPEYYQFAVVNDGYSGITAEQINSIIEARCVYQERAYGTTSALRGTGAYFVQAAKTYGVNEIYLLAHAALESAWGCSSLSNGTYGVYNFFGIGAIDTNPTAGGIEAAQNWSTPELGIMSGANWISSRYHNRKSSGYSSDAVGDQDTLYKMRWDLGSILAGNNPWHQYATGITWAQGIAQVMNASYDYLGIDISETGLTFEVPVYKE